MTVSVNPVRSDNNDAQVLAAALGVAKDVFRVAMDEKQSKRANELNKIKEDTKAVEEKTKDEISFAKDFSEVPQGTPGALALPNRPGLFLPRDEVARREKLDFDRKKLASDAAKEKASSLAQNKQAGLAEMGLLAEEQYKKATTGTSYDPTVSGQFIDSGGWAPNFLKDENAVTASAAMDSWIESFLRDASGAAIPESERQAYKEIYFPVGGDSPQVVANKEALRQQKMANALAAGGQKPAEKKENKEPSLLEKAIAEKQRRIKNRGTAGNK